MAVVAIVLNMLIDHGAHNNSNWMSVAGLDYVPKAIRRMDNCLLWNCVSEQSEVGSTYHVMAVGRAPVIFQLQMAGLFRQFS